jgi:hypothetical protein
LGGSIQLSLYFPLRVRRHPYGAALVFGGSPYGLPDPPGGVDRKAVAQLEIESHCGLQQPKVALLDTVF